MFGVQHWKKVTRIGGGLSVGYTLLVHKRLNVEFGAGVWGGAKTKYNLYCCTECKELRKSEAGMLRSG